MRHAWFGSFALVVFGLAGTSFGQDLKPSVLWGAEDAESWTTESNWIFGEENRVPGEGDVASIRNGGMATVTSAAQATDELAITNGGVEVGVGGSLDITGSIIVGGEGTLNVTGGSIKSNTLANFGSLSLSEASSIAIAGDFVNVGTLSLAGGMIAAEGTATLTGSSIDLSSVPTLGNPIPFLTSSEVFGHPSSITVEGLAPEFDRGLGIHVNVEGGAASIDVGSIPIAVVNRTTGEVTVENVAGNGIEFIGYELRSSNGLLSSGTWNSLTDQGTSGWSAIPSSDANILTELNVAEATQLNVGDSISLGSAWGGTMSSPRDEDVALNVLMSDGRTVAGSVEYVGPLNDLVLTVDPETGDARLQHTSPSLGDLDVVGYRILSSGGALNVDGFVGIGEGFAKPSPTAMALTETSSDAGAVFSDGTLVHLGTIFTPGAVEDLMFEFGLAGAGGFQPGTVEYGEVAPLPPSITCDPNTGGDLDGDGMVAFSDFLVLSTNFGQAASDHTQGDFDCSGDVAFADFLLLSTNFGRLGEDPVVDPPVVDPPVVDPPVACDPNTGGDLDGDGMVAFSDFLILSTNFGQDVTDHTQGDFDCSGDVAFADFLTLSTNFGQVIDPPVVDPPVVDPPIVDPPVVDPPVACDPNTGGDMDGDGMAAFSDFLILSTNFGQDVLAHTQGDIDCSGDVAFADFLTLSTNFGAIAGGPVCDPNTGGDLDGDGMVAFSDFLILSTNFGQDVSDHTGGDFDCSGDVAFADFLILSDNFGQQVGAEASAVPEPSTGLTLLMGVLGMLTLRRRRVHVAAAMVVTCGCFLSVGASDSVAQRISTRFIRIHPEGPNNQINSVAEAVDILDGKAFDTLINEDIVGEGVLIVDFGGGEGSFVNDQQPWGNGVEDEEMTDFIQYISGVWEIPAGDYTLGFGSDDGGLLRFTNPDITFDDTFNEEGDTVDGDGTILFDGTRAHSWTSGTISIPAGGLTTGIEAFVFERDGGDSFEVGYIDSHFSGIDLNSFMGGGFELDNGSFGSWQLTNDPFVPVVFDPSDLNADGKVDFSDFTIMSDNWGDPYGFEEFFALREVFSAGGGEPRAVPEPSSFMLLISALAFLGIRRRRE